MAISIKSSWLLLLSASPITLFNTVAASQCECGYLDPTTQSLWTDASITYWNESNSAQDIVFNPTVSPSDFAASSSGDTGTGQESWASIESLNDWEDSFQATYRAGTKHNNSYITPEGLSLAVQPADPRTRISYGSEIVTRRRDILYGSLRTSMQAPAPYQGGTIMRWQAAYNSSDYISTSIFSSDEAVNSSYQWSYSNRRHSGQPYVNPLSALQNQYGFNEQRIDWIGPDALKFSTDGTSNATAQMWELNRKEDGNLPTLGGPISLRHSSNGENSQSQGPPIHHQPVSQIKYTRFFFNSSLPSRHSEFEQQCQQMGTPVCSTDDNTLRGSTAFSLEATQKIEAPKIHHEIPLYAIIAEAASGGIFVILLINALIERQLKAKRKEREFYVKQQQISTEGNEGQDGHADDHQASSMDDEDSLAASEETKAEFEKAMKMWEDPSKLNPESDSDLDSSEESDDEEDPDDPLRINKRNDIRSFGHGSFGHQDGLLTPGALPKYTAPTYYARSSIAASIASGSQTPAQLNANGYFEHDLQGLDERLLDLQESEIMEDGRSEPRPTHSRKGSASAAGHLSSNGKGLESIMDEEDISEGQTSHLNVPASSNGHSSVDHASGSRGFSYSGRGRLSRVASTVGSINDLPVPGSEDGHWGGGLLHGVGSPANRDSVPTSQSQTKLISSRAASFIETDGSVHAVTWNPRIVEWKAFDPSENEATGGQLAERADGKTTVAQRPQTPAIQAATGFAGWLGRVAKKLLVGEGGAGQTASGAARVEYLDGLRGFACFLVSFHHFMLIFYYNVTTPSGPAHYPQMERWLRNLLGAICTNGGFNIGVFFILAARVIANRYLVRGRLQDLAEATNRRVPRLMVPISAGMCLSYFLIEADAFHWLPRLASRSWSTWSYYQDYDNLGTFIDSWLKLWFTTPPNVPSVISTYATGILWTVPVIVSSSWTVFTCALIAYEIPNVKKRYSFYAVCFLLSWYADRFDYFFISGLVIADMDNKLKYRKLAADGVPLLPSFLLRRLPEKLQKIKVHGQVFAWIIMLTGAVVSWIDQVNGTGSDIPLLEHGIHPDWHTAKPKVWLDENSLVYTDPRLFDFFFVIGFFLLCDLCSSFRTFFQLRFWSAFGRNAFSLYLLHGVIFWSWGSWLTLQLLMKDVPYWATILITFITSYFWLAILCEAFTRTFDKWGVGLSKALWRETSGGLGRRV